MPGMLLNRGGSCPGTGSTAAACPCNHRKLRLGAFVWELRSQTIVCAGGAMWLVTWPGAVFCRGPYPSVLSALSGLSGASPSPPRQPASWPEITSTNLPGRGGVASRLCRLAMCFSLQGVPQEKPFPVFGSQWAVPSLLYWDSASSRRAREGSQYTGPLPFHLQCYVTTTQPPALVLLVSFIRCQDCFKKFPWPQFKQEYSWDVLDFRQSALNLRWVINSSADFLNYRSLR